MKYRNRWGWPRGFAQSGVTSDSAQPNSHYRTRFSLPRQDAVTNHLTDTIFTASLCCHYRIRFSLPLHGAVTTGYDSHYRVTVLSLPDTILTTASRCCHYRIRFSLPRHGALTTGYDSHYRVTISTTASRRCHYYRKRFSLPRHGAVTAGYDSHYRGTVLSLPDTILTTASRCCHYRIRVSGAVMSLPVMARARITLGNTVKSQNHNV